jgi:SAM-dependent methyltransferase
MPNSFETLLAFPGGRVLDIATGNGNFIKILLGTLLTYDEIVGIDTSENAATSFALDFKDLPRVQFNKMDAHELEFCESSFDTVCISNSLHHIADIDSVLEGMKRILRPGGHFIISEMYRDDQTPTQQTHVLLHHWWGAVDTAKGIFHHETFSRRQILDLANKLGLKDLNYTDINDLDENPKDPETKKYLNDSIRKSLKRLEGLPEEIPLRARGRLLRRRIQEIGFHGATILLLVGIKP